MVKHGLGPWPVTLPLILFPFMLTLLKGDIDVGTKVKTRKQVKAFCYSRSGGAYGRALRLLPTLPNYKAPRKIFKNLPSACKFSRLRLGNHMNLGV